jgi:hypothetical protein
LFADDDPLDDLLFPEPDLEDDLLVLLLLPLPPDPFIVLPLLVMLLFLLVDDTDPGFDFDSF